MAIGIRALCLEAKGYEFDLFMFRDWAVLAHDHGMSAVLHAPDQDYIGYHYLLWLQAALYGAIAGPGWQDDYLFLHVLKVPGALADLGVVLILYQLTARLYRQHSLPGLLRPLPGTPDVASSMGLLAAGLYALNPGVIFATAYWGQPDSVPTFFMVAALLAVRSKRLPIAWALLTCGFILKPHAVILYPVLTVLALRAGGPRELVRGAVVCALVMACGYAYFLLIGEGRTVIAIYEGIFTDAGTRISTSAWNTWWPAQVFDAPRPADAAFTLAGIVISYDLLSQMFTILAGLLVCAYLWRVQSPTSALLAAAFLAFSFYMLPMKIHERYLFPFFAFMAPVAVQNRKAFILYLLLTLTYAANLFGVFQVFYGEFFKQRDVGLLCAGLNIICYLAFAAALARDVLRPNPNSGSDQRSSPPGESAALTASGSS